MNKLFYLFIVLLIPIASQAQYGAQQIISSSDPGAHNVIPADLNGDGFVDIISLSSQNHEIKWYENIDNNGTFSSGTVVSDTPALFLHLQAVDLDSDGDLDLLYLENNPKRVVWKENIDGNATFGPEQVILENQDDHIMEINAVDLNNNDFIDIIVRYGSGNSFIVWYENTNGQAIFNDAVLLVDDIYNAYGPLVEDIDNDGHLDLLLAHENLDAASVVWYKNLGNTTFGTEQLVHHFDFFVSDSRSVTLIRYADINSDDKKDIVISSYVDTPDYIYYYDWAEHLDGQGNFGEIVPLPNTLRDPFNFYDLDNDGDNDILGVNHELDEVYWFQNEDGLGTFGTKKIISNEVDSPRKAVAANIFGDDDDYLEVVSASFSDNKVAWYKFLGLSNDEFHQQQLTVYPNPTAAMIILETPYEISEISITDLQGKLVYVDASAKTIDISHLKTGMYFLSVSFDSGSQVIKKVIKQ